LEKKPIQLPLSLPQILHGLALSLNLGLHGERLVTSHLSNGMSLDTNSDKQCKYRNRMTKIQHVPTAVTSTHARDVSGMECGRIHNMADG
jgi:hypothetical protein